MWRPLQDGQTPRPLQRATGRAGHPWQKEAGPKGDALNATIHSAAVVRANRTHTHKEADLQRLDRQHDAEQFDQPRSSRKRETTVRLKRPPFRVRHCRASLRFASRPSRLGRRARPPRVLAIQSLDTPWPTTFRPGRSEHRDPRGSADHPSCPWKKPSMAFFHLGDTPKSRGFWGSPIAASCGGRLFPQPASARIVTRFVTPSGQLRVRTVALAGRGRCRFSCR
jgi:hypothetical protein